MITLDLLKNHLEAMPQLANIWHEVLGKIWIPDKTTEQVIQEFSSHLNDKTIPITLIALDDGKPIGMCSLREDDGIAPDFIYAGLSAEAVTKIVWLGSLVVDPSHQKQGVGKLLIEATKNKAIELGFNKLFLFALDKTLPNYYSRLGWTVIGQDEFKGHPVTVMEAAL
jgi:GNAT superfamily N-acetyltransferase